MAQLLMYDYETNAAIFERTCHVDERYAFYEMYQAGELYVHDGKRYRLTSAAYDPVREQIVVRVRFDSYEPAALGMYDC